MKVIDADDFNLFLLSSRPGHIYHQIPVGHGEVSNQTVAEKHLWDHR